MIGLVAFDPNPTFIGKAAAVVQLPSERPFVTRCHKILGIKCRVRGMHGHGVSRVHPEDTMMTFTNRRHQRAVGQGFFHTAELAAANGRKLRYVYDCGAMRKYEKQRNLRIDKYLRQIKSDCIIDVLFISHIHFDHISGIERLLDKTKGAQVDTIVLPLISAADRLFAYARAVTEDPTTIYDPFFRDLVANPTNALERFGPRQILFVQRGLPSGSAPGSGRGGDDDPDRPRDIPGVQGIERDGRLHWKLIGRGAQYEQSSIDTGETQAVTRVYFIDDTLALVIASEENCFEWILSPFVDPNIQSKEDRFLSELARIRGLPVPDLKSWLAVADNIAEILQNGAPDLTAAYHAVAKDFNLTSLCLYSGPKAIEGVTEREYHAHLGSYSPVKTVREEIGWLATGDAALKFKKRAAAFEKHYGNHLKNTGTLTLPHHGSDHNHNSELVKKICAFANVAAADAYSGWKHPGTEVIQCVASMGRFLSVVTGNSKSEVKETIIVRCVNK